MPTFDEEFGPLRKRAVFDEKSMKVLEDNLGYEFNDRYLLEEALTHSSFSRENGLFHNNERLEFLGDSILSFVIARALYRMYPDAKEGELTHMRAELVKSEALYQKAEMLNIPYLLLHGRSIKSSNLPHSICADAVESVLGAVCLDSGVAAADRVIKKLFLQNSDEQEPEYDPKTALQIWLQKHGMDLPKYELMSVKGPSHAPEFTVRLYMNGFEHIETDKTRKGAEAKVAKLVLNDLRAKFGEE
ncbi:MAG: ribonuclease III [Synergistaceae bacterium]|nr:ribonuclease III [Synergistaceae bacterium]MBR0093940.1 ribonuclease III [Synergistaceae bacterium]